MKAPFTTIFDEVIALRAKSDYYEAKMAVLRTKKPVTHILKKQLLHIFCLNQQCQAAIAFYYSNAMIPRNHERNQNP